MAAATYRGGDRGVQPAFVLRKRHRVSSARRGRDPRACGPLRFDGGFAWLATCPPSRAGSSGPQRVVAGLDRVEVPEKFARAPTTTGFGAPLAVLRTASWLIIFRRSLTPRVRDLGFPGWKGRASGPRSGSADSRRARRAWWQPSRSD